MNQHFTERYQRHLLLPGFGIEGQQRLLDARVLIIGLGGLGCPVALYLTAAGVGTIGLCDADTVSLSNLQRQTLYCEDMIGQTKAVCARQRLSALSSHTRFVVHTQRLTEQNALAVIRDYDLVVDCTDNFATRYVVDDACKELKRPWVFGAIGEFNGCVAMMMPDGPRLGVLFGDTTDARKHLEEQAPATTAVLGATPGVVGALQATEALKHLAGLPTALNNRILTIDLLSMATNILDL